MPLSTQYRINWLEQFGKLSGTKCEAIGENSELVEGVIPFKLQILLMILCNGT